MHRSFQYINHVQSDMMVQGIVITSPLIYVIQARGKNFPNVHKISAEREIKQKKINYILLNKLD